KCCVTEVLTEGAYYQYQKPIQLHEINIEIFLAEHLPAKGLTAATVQNTRERIYIHERAFITNNDIIEAHVVGPFYGEFNVEATLTDEAAVRMSKISQAHRGRPLAIVVDKQVVSAPIIVSEIHEKFAL